MENKISIHGFGHTSYARFYLRDKYEEWAEVVNQGGASPTKFDRDDLWNGVRLLLPKRFNVDLSVIKNDGGGTQYTFLEAWDAGCVQIINKEWLIDGDEMVDGDNCIAVSDEHELKDVLENLDYYYNLAHWQEAGYESLKSHSPEMIVPRYIDEVS